MPETAQTAQTEFSPVLAINEANEATFVRFDGRRFDKMFALDSNI